MGISELQRPKMRKLLICLALCFIVVLEAIPVTIYYEALCSDSVNFITRQLYPNYQFFKQHLDIEFVPYGKAMHTLNQTTGRYSFSCQHGNEECKGNKLQACGLAQLDNQDTKLDFVTCVMSALNPSNIYYIEKCVKKYNMDFAKLTKCAVTSEGDMLLASNGNKTWELEPNLYYVPTVVFNNSIQINAEDQRNSMDDFKDVMCRKLNKNKPEVCNDISFVEKIKHFFS